MPRTALSLYSHKDADALLFVDHITSVAKALDWGRAQELRQHCWSNGHTQKRMPRFNFIEDTPDRGRWISQVSCMATTMSHLFIYCRLTV